jgi:acetate kinase
MKIIVCNIGSTSFKFQLLDMKDESVLCRGNVERVGSEKARIRFYSGKDDLRVDEEKPIPDQGAAVRAGLAFLTADIIQSLDGIDAVGFKTVQAGEENGSVLLSDKVIRAMEEYSDVAPAHNPPYLAVIRIFKELMPKKDLVGVFEPGFHTEKPEYAKVYGTPLEWYEKYGIMKYGYHGASHRYVTGETVRRLHLNPDKHKVISCHLGGSSSLCAFKDGESIDASMGFSAQSGIIQSTRTGDIDAFVIPFIMKRKGITMEQAYRELSSNGGVKGLSGTSGDMRDILDAMANGSKAAKLARDKYTYDVKFYMGAYILLMGGVDAICFTGGIGQKDPELREDVLVSLEFLGFKLDRAANDASRERLDAPGSKIAAIVLETDEELIVARETKKVVEGR